MIRKTLFFFFLFCFTSVVLCNNKEKRDSLKGELITVNNEDEKLIIYHQIMRLAESESELNKLYFKASNITSSNDSLNIATEKTAAEIYWGIFKNDEQSIFHNLEALKKAESIRDLSWVATINYSIGVIYFWRGDLDKCKLYIEESLNSYPSYKSQLGKATTMMALGVILQNDTTTEKESLYYLTESLRIKKEAGAWREVPVSLSNLAELKAQMGDTLKAIQHLKEAIVIADSTNVEAPKIYATFILGYYQSSSGQYEEGISNIRKAISWWSDRKGYLKDLPRAYDVLSKAYKGSGDYKKATEALDSLLKLNNEIYEEKKIAKLQEMETKYQTEKKELELVKEKQQSALAKKETELVEKEKTFQIYIFSIVAFFLVFNIYYFFQRYKKQKKDKELISFQKEEIAERNQEIEDSITYAQRIQSALLPQKDNFKSNFSDAFILYIPKDIVAGDFYFFEKNKKDDSCYYSVADCTGHGVPGAMVSVVGINGLKRCIREFGLKNTGSILDQLSLLVTETFEESGEEIQDGMDLSLIKTKVKTVSSFEIEYSGANNPIWIVIRKDDENTFKYISGDDTRINKNLENDKYTLIEIKGDKQPIGLYTNKKAFTSHLFEAPKGTRLYATTDGFQDQFGGEKFAKNKAGGKKFKAKNFKKLILEYQNLSLKEQEGLLNKTYKEWKGDLEQVDDICVVSVEL